MRKLRSVIYFFLVCFLIAVVSLTVFGADAEKTRELIENETGRVVAVSHNGDTAVYPANSLEAIISARDKGADAVSVAVSRIKDTYILCQSGSLATVCDSNFKDTDEAYYTELKKCKLYDSSGSLTDCHIISLTEALETLDGSVYLILDIDWENRDDVYEIVANADALSYVSLRAEVTAKKAAEWAKGRIDVISIYKGNIIWNSIGHISKATEAGMTMAEYRTKNYFNVCYGTLVGDSFSANGNARAVAACYNSDFCGKRADSPDGWSQLTDDGFTVIETNNIEGLVAYIERTEKARQSLSEVLVKAKSADFSAFSSASADNINKAIKNAEDVLSGRVCSLEKTEKAYSELISSLDSKRLPDGKAEAKGELNITVGKIIAVFLVGAAILTAQIFIEKKRKK